MPEPSARDILNWMMEYQKENNISKMCMQNVQYFCDCANASGTRHRARAEAMIAAKMVGDGDSFVVAGHLVAVLTDTETGKETMVEPSYEIRNIRGLTYMRTISDFVQWCDDIGVPPHSLHSEGITHYLRKHMHMVKIAERMNGGDLCITNKEEYDAQADFVDMKANQMRTRPTVALRRPAECA